MIDSNFPFFLHILTVHLPIFLLSVIVGVVVNHLAIVIPAGHEMEQSKKKIRTHTQISFVNNQRDTVGLRSFSERYSRSHHFFSTS